MGWPRWLTLSKSKNSLDDILGAELTAVLKGGARVSIQRELDTLFAAVTPGVSGVAGKAVVAVQRALGGNVPPMITAKIEAAVTDGMRSADAALNGARPGIERAVLKALGL